MAPFLAMAKLKQAWLCSSGLTKRFVYMYVCTNVRKYIIKTFVFSFFRSLKNPFYQLDPRFKHSFDASFRSQLLVLFIGNLPLFMQLFKIESCSDARCIL